MLVKSVQFCVCALIDHKLRHNIVKVAVDNHTHNFQIWYDEIYEQLEYRRIENWRQLVFYSDKKPNGQMDPAFQRHHLAMIENDTRIQHCRSLSPSGSFYIVLL